MTIFRDEKPLFVPLATVHFNAFDDGLKDTEMRVDGPRWNAATCQIGRRVILSKGYGKWKRISGKIVSFARREWAEVPQSDKAILEACGIKDKPIAYIGIKKDE